MNGTNYYDGTAAITECGIPPGQFLVYKYVIRVLFAHFVELTLRLSRPRETIQFHSRRVLGNDVVAVRTTSFNFSRL